MPTAVIGQPYTFHALFLDADNDPVVATAPTIKIFRFNSVGGEVAVALAAMTAVAGDTGRYRYTLTISSSYTAGMNLFAVMSGTNPADSALLVIQDSVELLNAPQTGTMNARFVQ